MELNVAIPVSALIISLSSLIWSQISANRTAAKAADQSYVASLEKRVDRLEKDNQRLQHELDQCVTLRDGLQRETVELLRRLAQIKEE